MVGGIGPGVPYSPAVALAALTATLVTLILAFNTWWTSEGKGDSEEKKAIESRKASIESSSVRETPSEEEEESTATSYIISTSLTESDKQYNDYELDSIEELTEGECIKLKVDSTVRLIHDDPDVLEFVQFPQDDTITVSQEVAKRQSQSQKSQDLKLDSESMESYSSKSGVNGEISTSVEYKWMERKTGHASLHSEHSVVVSSSESDVNQQGGTKSEDLEQTTPQFVQFESELATNCSRNSSQTKREVFSAHESDEIVPADECVHKGHELNSRESFDMKVADFEELEEVCNNEIIFQQMDSENMSIAVHYSVDSHNVPACTLNDNITQSSADDILPDLSIKKSNDEEEQLSKSNDLEKECISQNIISAYDKNYEALYKSFGERHALSKINESSIEGQCSAENFLIEEYPVLFKSFASVEEKKKEDTLELKSEKEKLTNNIQIASECVNPDILQHSSSQREKSIPDIVQSSPYSNETMNTSDTLFFLYDEAMEKSKRATLEVTEHNLFINNPIIALTEKLFQTEKFLSKSSLKTEPIVIYQKANGASEDFTHQFYAREKDDPVLKHCQLTEDNETPVALSSKAPTVSQQEKDDIEKISGDSGVSMDEVRRERGPQLVSGDDKVKKEEEEEEDEGEVERRCVNSGRDTSSTNNGGVHSCLPSTADVTSGAMHHGPPVREVQGSGREKLIGKACASQNYHNSITASPAEGERKNESPPQMVPAKDLEMAARSCKKHEPGSNPILLSSSRQSDKLDRLDALVDHLRELAGDSPHTEDDSLGAITDHDADVSDNVTSTTENSAYVSANSEFISSSNDINKRYGDKDSPTLHDAKDTFINKPSIDCAYNNDKHLDYSPQCFGLLSEYYTEENSGAQEKSVSDNNAYIILAPILTDAEDTIISSDDSSLYESLNSWDNNEKSFSNDAVQNDNLNAIKKENSDAFSKSESVTLSATDNFSLKCKRLNATEKIIFSDKNEGNGATNLTIELTVKENRDPEIMAESRDRLLKLLERNQKRQERLKHLSKLTNEPGRDNENSSKPKNDSKETLDALESAIGHIQQLIHKDSATNFRRNELDLARRTMVTSRSTEAISGVSILGKDNQNTHAHHDQMKCSSTVDRTRIHHVHPIDRNKINHTKTVHSREHPQNITSYNARSKDWKNETQNVSKNVSVVKEWEINSSNKKNAPMNDFGESENAKVFAREEGRWRDEQPNEADDRFKTPAAFALNKHGLKRNYEPLSQRIERTDFYEDNLNAARFSDENLSSYEVCSFNIEREPKPKIQSMSIDTGRGRCESHDVAVSELVRLRAAERTAVAERQSFRNDITREEFLRPLVMQDQQQNGEGSDGSVKSDSPTKQNAATNTTTTTPTKVKNLRFKLDPDIYDLPSENGYEDEEDDSDYRYRRGWKRHQPKYQAFSSLELGRKNGTSQEPVKVVSVRTSVVPGSQKIQKMVVKPVCVSEGQRSKSESEDTTVTVKHLDIDLHIRLETSENGQKASEPTNDVVRGDWRASPEKHLSKRQYITSSPSGQHTKKRSPLPDFSGWNQSLSPVTENCDWTPGASESAEDIALLSTNSDPGQRHRWTPDSGHQSPASWDVEDASFRFKNDFPKSETLDSFLAMDSGECNVQRTDESRHVTLSRSSDNFSLDNDSPKSDSAASISSSNSIPTRPSSLSLSHFRKHLNLPKKRFVPDPEAIERITGYKAAEQTSSSRPPLPPGLVRPMPSYRLGSGAKNRIDQLRKRYLDSAKSQMMAAQKADGISKFEQFLSQAQRDRANLVTSTPDLAAFEAAVRRQWSKTTMENKRKASTENSGDSSKENTPPPVSSEDSQYRSRSNTPDHVWMSYVQLLRRQLNRRSQSLSYLETDVDAIFGVEDLSQSMTTLDRSPSPESSKSVVSMPICNTTTKPNRISISLEESGRTKSEHELRIEKSLQNLTLPDWYKHSSRPKTGFLLDKKSPEKRGWAAAKSLASSTSSLASSDPRNKRSARSLRASRENLPWSRGSASPASADNSFRGWSRSNSGPVLSLALAKAFREPYIGWRARTPSSCASSSPQVDLSPPSWVVMGDNTNTDRSETPLTSDFQGMDEEGDTGISFDGEDILEEDSTSDPAKDFVKHRDSLLMEVPSADDTCDDVINISMDTCDDQRAPPLTNGRDTNNSRNAIGEDTCEDIKNITLDTFDDQPCDKVLSPQTGDDTCDDVLNISTDTTSSRAVVLRLNGDTDRNVSMQRDSRESTDRRTPELNCVPPSSKPLTNGSSSHHSGSESPVVHRSKDKELSKSKFDPKRKRYSYNRSIYQNELDGLRRDNDQKTLVDIRCSTRSLPAKNRDYDEDEKDSNKVIWIESSFVGSRTTTSIVVLPTHANGEKDGHKGENTGSNSSVGRPASR